MGIPRLVLAVVVLVFGIAFADWIAVLAPPSPVAVAEIAP